MRVCLGKDRAAGVCGTTAIHPHHRRHLPQSHHCVHKDNGTLSMVLASSFSDGHQLPLQRHQTSHVRKPREARPSAPHPTQRTGTLGSESSADRWRIGRRCAGARLARCRGAGGEGGMRAHRKARIRKSYSISTHVVKDT